MTDPDPRDPDARAPSTPDAQEAVPRLLISPQEAAFALGVSRSKVYELIGSGRLQSVSIDRSRRIRATDLAAFIDGLEGDFAERDVVPTIDQTSS